VRPTAGTTPEPRAHGASSATIATGSARLFWAQVVGNAGLFVGLLLIARALGPSGRGTVAFITVTSLLVAWIARFGVGEATVVFFARRPSERATLFGNIVFFAGTAGSVGAAIVCTVLALVPSLRPAGLGNTELAALGVSVVGATFADAGYKFVLASSRFRLHARVTMATSWMYAALIATLWAAFGLTPARAAFAWGSVHAVRAIVLLAASARAIGVRAPNLSLFTDCLRFGLRAWVGSLADNLNFRIDQIIVALIASEATLGIYAVAVNAFEVLLYLPGGAATALLPLVAGSAQPLRGERTLHAFRSVVFVTSAGLAVAAVLGPFLLPLVFGSAYANSVTPFLLLLPGALGAVLLAIFTNALVASSAPGLSSLGPLASLFVGLALDFALIPSFGASGAAAAATAAFFAGGVTAVLAYKTRDRFRWRDLVVPQRGDLDILAALFAALPRRQPAAVDVAPRPAATALGLSGRPTGSETLSRDELG
jgi:O-antigen/teichoic acid export membrane protein